MRVMHVMESTLGGTRRYLEDCFHALEGEPFPKALVYGTARADAQFPALLAEMRAAGWETFEIASLGRAIDARRDLRSLLALRRLVRAWKPSIVHLHSSKAGALGRVARFGLRDLKVCYNPHSISAGLGRIYLAIERLLAPLTDAYVAVCESERDELERYRLARVGRVRVAVPSVRGQVFAPGDRAAARAELGVARDVPLVVGIGRMAAQKDPLGFVATLAAVRRSHPEALGIWVGDGELRDAFLAAARAAGLEGVCTVSGWTSDVRPYLTAADVFVSTSVYESFGYVTAEALAMERPAVASSIVGTTDIVTVDCETLLYPRGDFAAAAARVVALLDDPQLARAVGARGRGRILEAFSSAVTRRDLLDLYGRLERDDFRSV